MIQSWIKSDGMLGHCPDVIAACFLSIGDGRASGIEWSHVHGRDALFTSFYWGCCWRKSWFWSAPVTFSRQSQVLLKESFKNEGRSSVSDGGKRKDLAKALFVDIREAVDLLQPLRWMMLWWNCEWFYWSSGWTAYDKAYCNNGVDIWIFQSCSRDHQKI